MDWILQSLAEEGNLRKSMHKSYESFNSEINTKQLFLSQQCSKNDPWA